MAEKQVSGTLVAPFNCWRCGCEIAKSAGPGTDQKCRRCGARNIAPTAEQAAQIVPAREASRPSKQQALDN